MTLGSKTFAFSFMIKILQNTHRLAENKLTDLSLWAKTNSHKMPVYKGGGLSKIVLRQNDKQSCQKKPLSHK